MRARIRVLVADNHVLPASRGAGGGRGYLLKDASPDDLVRAITSVDRGQSVLAPQAADRVHRQLIRPGAVADRPFPGLTEPEHDLLAKIVRGRSNHEIASSIGFTDNGPQLRAERSRQAPGP